jgi:hypothetical protein
MPSGRSPAGTFAEMSVIGPQPWPGANARVSTRVGASCVSQPTRMLPSGASSSAIADGFASVDSEFQRSTKRSRITEKRRTTSVEGVPLPRSSAAATTAFPAASASSSASPA